jgi:chemotaxis protein MotB
VSDGGGHGGGGRRRGHEEEHEEHENHERWLVSYADMMTLLMVLFIVMFAISQVDSKKFMALKTGLAAGFGAPLAMLNGADGLLDTGGAVAPDAPNIAGVAGNKSQSLSDPVAKSARMPDPANAINLKQVTELMQATMQGQVKDEVNNLKKAQAQLQKALAAAGMAKGASFRYDQRGLVVSIATDKVLFASGDATLLPGGQRILDALSPTLRKLPNHLDVDGHTDSNPIHTARYPDNLALSGDRAMGVERYLNQAFGIPLSRMSSTGYADTEPAMSGTSAKAMAADRRVEIVIVANVDNSAGATIAQLGNASTRSTARAGSKAATKPTTKTTTKAVSKTTTKAVSKTTTKGGTARRTGSPTG